MFGWLYWSMTVTYEDIVAGVDAVVAAVDGVVTAAVDEVVAAADIRKEIRVELV